MSDFKKPQTGDGRLAYFDFSVVKRNAHFALAERMQQKSGALRIDSAKVVDPVGRLLRFEGLQEYLFELLENFQRQVGGASFGASIQVRAVPAGLAFEL